MGGRPRRVAWVGLAACAAMVIGGVAASSVGASPIRSYRHLPPTIHARSVLAGASLGPAWARFLSGGPALWAEVHAPKIPSGLRLATRNGQLVETPFVEYLSWRRSLDPARFDHYHPIIGPALGQLLPPTVPQSVPVGQTVAPPPPFNPQPENGVPEPGTVPIALSLIAAGLWWRRRVARTAFDP